MAAGLSLENDNLAQFATAFEAEALRLLDADELQASILSDGEVEPQWFTLEVAEVLATAGPWGQEFPEPQFNGVFKIVQQRTLADKHLKLVLSPPELQDQVLDAIAFNLGPDEWPPMGASEISIAYRLDINEFRGKRSLQLMIEKILDYRAT